MFPKPKSALVPNTYPYESEPMVKATGFREYDARWLFGKEINLMGIQALGMGLGALIAELGARQEVVTGHDFRGYSASIKYALISGLQAAGCKVHDIGLCMTPMAYFAQFELDVPCVAMVTASHNDNGWTGVKMGANRPLTFGPDEMNRLNPKWNAMNSLWVWPDHARRVFTEDDLRVARDDPAVLHFEGPPIVKPWHYLSQHPFRDEYRFALLLDLVEPWANLGASELMLATLKDVTGLGEPGA